MKELIYIYDDSLEVDIAYDDRKLKIRMIYIKIYRLKLSSITSTMLWISWLLKLVQKMEMMEKRNISFRV